MVAHYQDIKGLFVQCIKQMVDRSGLLNLLISNSSVAKNEEMVGIICERLCMLTEEDPVRSTIEIKAANGHKLLAKILHENDTNEHIMGDIARILSRMFPR